MTLRDLTAEIDRAYPIEIIRSIATRHGFDGDDPHWHWCIRKAALLYLRHRPDRGTTAPTPRYEELPQGLTPLPPPNRIAARRRGRCSRNYRARPALRMS